MPTVTMPQLGESVAEGTIGKWLKQVGEHVDLGEPIVEVVTDKVNAEVPSPFEGTLTQILVGEGQTVPNEASIAIIEAAGSAATPERAGATPKPAATPTSASAATTASATPAPGAAPVAPPATPAPATAPIAVPIAPSPLPVPSATAAPVGEYRGRMTPAVRRLAREQSVDLGQVTGTGFGGRVTRDDILQYVAARGNGSAPAVASAATAAPLAPAAPARADACGTVRGLPQADDPDPSRHRRADDARGGRAHGIRDGRGRHVRGGPPARQAQARVRRARGHEPVATSRS